ncbi:MAG: TonB-dependent receptor plug domain-containing protein [Prevotella sp.]
MNRFFIIFASLAICITALGQSSSDMKQSATDVEICRQAEAAYRIGRFDEAVKLLTDYMPSLTARTRSTAYHLLSLCYMEKDNSDEASNYASLLLKENPYYTPTISDPLRFADMIEKMKSGKGATITTASQQAESVEETPVPVTLITEEMIKTSGARTLADLLVMYVPGMSVVEGYETNIAMHGVYSSAQEKILIMLDGHRLNSRATNAEAPDYRTSLDKIKQIEVLRGPASSLYGNVALTAVVNIITKSGYDVDGTLVRGGLGDNNTYTASLLLGKSVYELDLLLWASVYSSQGEKRSVSVGDEEFYGKVERDGFMYLNGYNHKPAYDIGLKLKWKDLKFMFTTQYAKKVLPYISVFYPSLYDYGKYRQINGAKPGRGRETTRMELSYDKNWGNWSGKISAFVDMESCSYYDIAGDTILPTDRYLPVGPGEIMEGIDPTKACDYGLYQVQSWNDYTYGGNLQASYSFKKGKTDGTLLFGSQIENYTMKDNTMIVGDHFDRVVLTYSDANKSILTGNELNFSCFTQLKMKFGQHLIFNGGLRYDHKKRYNDKKLDVVSPRLSFIYKIDDEANVKLSYSHSFVDAPYFYRATTIATYSGGSKLNAEEMDGYQLTISKKLPKLHLDCELNAYYNNLKNIVSFGAPNPSGDMLSNAGKLSVWGLEGTVSYHTQRFQANANVTYQKVADNDNYTVIDNHIISVADWMMNATAKYKLLTWKSNTLALTANVNYQSKQYTPIVSPLVFRGEAPYSAPDKTQKARAIVNGGIEYTHNKLTATLNVYNLLNTDYFMGSCTFMPFPQQHRNTLFSVAYKF